ncbi:hypothetical protein C5600_08185 [Klebsiella pneumoniae]|nr:hypothetical protein [Klebsiella pneumoniae]HBY2231612.1 hypothetical protein [Klebsiella pneumoniae]
MNSYLVKVRLQGVNVVTTIFIILGVLFCAWLSLVIVGFIHSSICRVRNSRWIINKLMSEYNYEEELARNIIIQVDSITKCKLLGKNKAAFLDATEKFIYKMTGEISTNKDPL